MLMCRAGGRPIQDWSDLLQPRLKGRLGFVDAPREFLGAALRSMGLSMNEDLSAGACSASVADIQAHVRQLRKQVDSTLSPFHASDTADWFRMPMVH